MNGPTGHFFKRPLVIILLIYMGLTIAYGITNPLFESPDEQTHYFTAQYIAERWQLPVAGDPVDKWMGQEAAQPPLYYVLSAVLIRPIDTSQAREQVWFNPFTRLGDASSPANTNHFVHSEQEAWPWQGHVLAAHLLRLVSAVIGLGTLLFIYGSARLVWPQAQERAWLAVALVAFLPQFNFLHASVSNDPLVIFFCAAALWQLLRLWYGGVSNRRLLLLGLTIGLAMLSKMAGLLLLLYGAGFLVVLTWQQRNEEGVRPLPGTIGKRLLLVIGPALLLAGWLLVRNGQLYGDITAASVFIRVAGGDRGYSLGDVFGETSGLWRSLFAVFGWMNVAPPDWLYIIWNGLVVLAVGGVILVLVRAAKQRNGRAAFSAPSLLRALLNPPFLLAVWVLMVYAGLVQFLLKTPAAQGRLLFPALVPLSLGMAYGLSRWRQQWLFLAVPALILTASLYSLFLVIPAAYEKPPIIAEGAVPAEAARIEQSLGQGVRLVAAVIETETAAQGDWVWMTFYWQGEDVPEEAPNFVVELLGREAAILGKLQSYHGGGLFPATLWPPGQVVVDRAALQVEVAPDTPLQGRLNLKLEGEETAVDVGTVKILPNTWPEPAGPALAEVAGAALTSLVISETAVSPGDTLHLTVQWHVLQPPGRDLTTFVHLGEQTSPPLAQGDSPPIDGHYPTHLWAEGEVINDAYRLMIPADLPAGRYPLHIGFYSPETGERPPVTVEGVQQPNNAYFAGWIEVGG